MESLLNKDSILSLNTVVNFSTYRQLTTGYLKLSGIPGINNFTNESNKKNNKKIKFY